MKNNYLILIGTISFLICCLSCDNSVNSTKGITYKNTKLITEEGKKFIEQKKYNEAIVKFNKSIELNVNDTAAYFYRGLANIELANYKVALLDFNKVLILDPTNKQTYFQRGVCNYWLKNNSDAISDFDLYLMTYPNDPEAYSYKGFIYYYSHDYQNASLFFNKSLALKSNAEIWVVVAAMAKELSLLDLSFVNKYKIFVKKADSLGYKNVEEAVNKLIEKNKQTDFNGSQNQIMQAQVKENAEWDASKAGKIWKKHPEWEKSDCKKIANNEIWIGMSYDMLVFERGKPNSVNPSNYGNGTEWQWCWDGYTPSCFYAKDDKIITSYN